MSGHVGIIANDAGRYTMFSVCLTSLRHPVNTQILWRLTSDRIIGRNGVVEDALAAGTEWLLFLDDDHTFPAEILNQLLSHDLPVVGALYVQRQPPFAPIAYGHKDDDGMYWPLDLTSLPEKGLVEVVACGTGGMLLRAEVLRAVRDASPDGVVFEHGRASEDMIFCDKVRDLGIPIHVDAGIRLGHLSMSACWPTFADGQWQIGFSLSDGFSLQVPVEAPEPDLVGATPE